MLRADTEVAGEVLHGFLAADEVPRVVVDVEDVVHLTGALPVVLVGESERLARRVVVAHEVGLVGEQIDSDDARLSLRNVRAKIHGTPLSYKTPFDEAGVGRPQRSIRKNTKKPCKCQEFHILNIMR